MLVKWAQTQRPSTALIKQDYSRSEDNQQVRAVYLRRIPILLYLPAMAHFAATKDEILAHSVVPRQYILHMGICAPQAMPVRFHICTRNR